MRCVCSHDHRNITTGVGLISVEPCRDGSTRTQTGEGVVIHLLVEQKSGNVDSGDLICLVLILTSAIDFLYMENGTRYVNAVCSIIYYSCSAMSHERPIVVRG